MREMWVRRIVCDRIHKATGELIPVKALCRLVPHVAAKVRAVRLGALASGARMNGGRDKMIQKRLASPSAFCGARNAQFSRSSVRRPIRQIETAFTSKTAALRAACNTAQENSQ